MSHDGEADGDVSGKENRMSTIYAPVKDGQIVETGSQNSLKKANAGDKNSMDKIGRASCRERV